MLIRHERSTALLALLLASVGSAQQRSPFFATVVGPDGAALADAQVTCVFTPNRFAVGAPDVVVAVTDARGRARCNLVVGRLYTAWAIGPAADDGEHVVSEPVPLAASGRVMELQAAERRALRSIAVAGLDAWRELGAVGMSWFPDQSQYLHVDLPLPEHDEVRVPSSPWTTGLLGVRDAAGEVMVVHEVGADGDRRIELAAPMAIRAVVRDMRGRPLADVRLEHSIGGVMDWGVFGTFQHSNHYRVAGTTDVDGVARLHVPRPDGLPVVLLACKRGHTLEHRVIEHAGVVTFGLDVAEPRRLHVAGTKADWDLAADVGYTVQTGRGVRFDRRRIDVTADGTNRWLVHAADAFRPSLARGGSLPGAVVWDWIAEPAPERIDLGRLIEVDLAVVTKDGGPTPAGIGILHGTRSVPLRWEQLLATNLAGRAQLWLPRGEHLVYATNGTAHAYAVVDGDVQGPMQLRLQDLPTMRVRVRDAAGSVRGAKASVARTWTGMEAPREVAMYMSRNYAQLGRSDADGMLSVRLFALPGMKFELKVGHRGRESAPFPFVADGEAEVVLRE